MQLIPAIDLLDGRCVRLLRGEFGRCQFYPESPETIAQRYAEAGAEWLHVVDLAASRDGEQADTGPLFAVLTNVSQKVQTGGGVRSADDVEARLRAGAERVVVGSIAAENPDLLIYWLKTFAYEQIVAALDVRFDDSGRPTVRTRGWTQDSGKSLWELLDELVPAGLIHVLCTDISRDGALGGPNLDLYASITRRYPGLQLQASGGVRDLDDLRALLGTGASAAISGKALLDGLLDVREALEVLA